MRILVRLVLNWRFLWTLSRFCATLSAIGCIYILMSHVTHMNVPCHTHEWFMSHIWTQICMNELRIMSHPSPITAIQLLTCLPVSCLPTDMPECVHVSECYICMLYVYIYDIYVFIYVHIYMCIMHVYIYICIYICLYTYTHIYIYIYIYIYLYIHIHVYNYNYNYIYISLSLSLYIYIWYTYIHILYICIYLCICMHVYHVCVYINIHINIHIYIWYIYIYVYIYMYIYIYVLYVHYTHTYTHINIHKHRIQARSHIFSDMYDMSFDIPLQIFPACDNSSTLYYTSKYLETRTCPFLLPPFQSLSFRGLENSPLRSEVWNPSRVNLMWVHFHAWISMQWVTRRPSQHTYVSFDMYRTLSCHIFTAYMSLFWDTYVSFMSWNHTTYFILLICRGLFLSRVQVTVICHPSPSQHHGFTHISFHTHENKNARRAALLECINKTYKSLFTDTLSLFTYMKTEICMEHCCWIVPRQNK